MRAYFLTKRYVVFGFLGVFTLTCRSKEPLESQVYARLTMPTALASPDGVVQLQAQVLTPGASAIVDHGFVWRTSNPSDSRTSLQGPPAALGAWERISLGPLTGTTFSANVTYGLSARQAYVVRPFVQTTDGYVTYGPLTDFTTDNVAPPVVSRIDPATPLWGDTVTLTGQNFSYRRASVRLRVGAWGDDAPLVSTSPTQIRFVVPNWLDAVNPNYAITVTTDNGQTTAEQRLVLNTQKPVITSFAPATTTFGEQVVITGRNFVGDTTRWRVVFEPNGQWPILVTPTQITPTTLTFRVPALMRSQNRFQVALRQSWSSAGYGWQWQAVTSDPSPQPLVMRPPVLRAVFPTTLTPAQDVTLQGANFSAPVVMFAGAPAQIRRYTSGEIVVDPSNGVYPAPTASVQARVVALEQQTEQTVTVQYTAPWVKRANQEVGPLRPNARIAGAFTDDNAAYLIQRDDSAFPAVTLVWRYDPTTYQWREVPALSRAIAAIAPFWGNFQTFVSGDKTFVMGFPTSDQSGMLSVHRRTGDIQRLGLPPLTNLASNMVVAGLGNKAYLVNQTQLWEYTPASDTWRLVQNALRLPNDFVETMFEVDGALYVVTTNRSLGGGVPGQHTVVVSRLDVGTGQFTPVVSQLVATSNGSRLWSGYGTGAQALLFTTSAAYRFIPGQNSLQLISTNPAARYYGAMPESWPPPAFSVEALPGKNGPLLLVLNNNGNGFWDFWTVQQP